MERFPTNNYNNWLKTFKPLTTDQASFSANPNYITFQAVDELNNTNYQTITINLVQTISNREIKQIHIKRDYIGAFGGYTEIARWYHCDQNGTISDYISSWGAPLYLTQNATVNNENNPIQPNSYFRLTGSEASGPIQVTFTFKDSTGSIIDQIPVKSKNSTRIIGPPEYIRFYYNGIDVTTEQK